MLQSAEKHDDLISTDINDCSINVQSTLDDEPLLMQAEQEDKDKQERTEEAEKAATPSATATKVLFLDGLRGLSAILIVMQHSNEYMTVLAPLFAITCVALWVMDDEAMKRYFFSAGQAEIYDLFKTLTFHFCAGDTLTTKVVVGALYSGVLWAVIEGCNNFRTSHQALRPHIPTLVVGSMAAVIFFKLDTWIKANKFQYRFIHKLILRMIEFSAFSVLLSVVFFGLFFIWVHENPVEQTGGAPLLVCF
ncbi:unnamed protein product [Peronospora destructor]|uniref:Acyltransferase 3 domain-containing protein n=1 Tax=Peronospora destructor TaxID=86335 RepID=A0AAV0V104_9STRA|nr:unnamed protein product [Peronospora destructor]